MALHFLDDVLGLHLALESPQCVLQTLTFLDPYFRQTNTPPNRTELDLCNASYDGFLA